MATYVPQKAEDSAHTSGDNGVPIQGVRNDKAATRTSDDGDYGFPALDAAGRVGVTTLGDSLRVALNMGELEPVPVSVADADVFLEQLASLVAALMPMSAKAGAAPGPYAAGMLVRPLTTLDGVPYAIGGHPNAQSIEYSFGTAAQTNVKLVQAPPGMRIAVTRCSFMVSKNCTVSVGARIGFEATPTSAALPVVGTATLVPTAAPMVLSHPKISAGSGVVEGNGMAKLAQGGDGCSLFLTCDISTGGATNNAVRVMITYFLEPS